MSMKHHTEKELYEHRYALFLSLLVLIDDESGKHTWKSKVHEDGTMFDDSFIAGIEFPLGSVRYHLPLRYWDNCDAKELPAGLPYDGHTSIDTLNRLRAMNGLPEMSAEELK